MRSLQSFVLIAILFLPIAANATPLPDIANTDEIEFTGNRYQLDVVNGRGVVYITGRNSASYPVIPHISATLYLNDIHVNFAETGYIQPRSYFSLPLTFTGIDPLSLIKDEVQARVVISVRNRVLTEFTSVLNVEEKEQQLARYFNHLINGRGFLTQSTDRGDRIAAVRNFILLINEKETSTWARGGPKTNFWRFAPAQTMIGKLLAEYRAMQQSLAAIEHYNYLTRLLARSRRNLPMFVFKSSKRIYYERLLRGLSTQRRPW